jgi:hypothetical protein
MYKAFSYIVGVYSDDLLQFLAAFCTFGVGTCRNGAQMHTIDALPAREPRPTASHLLPSFLGGGVATFSGDHPRLAPYLYRKASKSSVSGDSSGWC